FAFFQSSDVSREIRTNLQVRYRYRQFVIKVQPHHLAVLLDLFAVCSQFFSKLDIWDAIEVLEQPVDCSKLAKQVGGGLLTDSIDPGYIVHAIADESEYLADRLRWHAPFAGHFRNSKEGVRIFRVFEVALVCGIDFNRTIHQLKKVLIVGRQNRLDLIASGSDRIAGHQVVCLSIWLCY